MRIPAWLIFIIFALLVSAVSALNVLDKKEDRCHEKGGVFSYAVVADAPGLVQVETTCTFPDGDAEVSMVFLRDGPLPPLEEEDSPPDEDQ